MADFWKSQGRKFCDFCKCWIADNKPSIEFHEGGKKHKENVAKRLKEIHRNSAKNAKINKKFESCIKTMENAAMVAYRKDVQENTLDLTAKEIIREKHKKNDELSNVSLNPNQMPIATPEINPRHKKSQHLPGDVDFCDPTTFYRTQVCLPTKNINDPDINHENRPKSRIHREKRNGNRGIEDIFNKKSVSKLWYEARSTEGFTYYWHLESKVTSWEQPKEGFMTFREQEEEAKERLIQTEFLHQIEQEEMKYKAENFEEQRANAVRERSKRIREQYIGNNNSIKENRKDVKDNEEKKYTNEIPYRRDYSIPEKVDAYGPWQTIEMKSAKGIDLQLPKRQVIQLTQSVISEPFKEKAFAEKTITKIYVDVNNDDGVSTTFKKRKFGNRNVRKRFDDD